MKKGKVNLVFNSRSPLSSNIHYRHYMAYWLGLMTEGCPVRILSRMKNVRGCGLNIAVPSTSSAEGPLSKVPSPRHSPHTTAAAAAAAGSPLLWVGVSHLPVCCVLYCMCITHSRMGSMKKPNSGSRVKTNLTTLKL